MSDQRADELIRRGPSIAPIHTWILGLLVALLALAIAGLWGLYFLRGRFTANGPTPTAIIWTATPSPISTARPSSTPTEPASGAGEGATEATPTASSEITVGSRVQVAGTGGYGLSLREGPGTDYARKDVAADGETFIVVDGPASAEGSSWWRIRDPENEERTWWAIGNYLRPVEGP